MAVAGAGAGAEIIAKVGAGAENKNFGSATLDYIHYTLYSIPPVTDGVGSTVYA